MFDRLMGKFLVEEGMLSKGQLDQVYRSQEENRAKLGVIAVSEKLMTIAQAEEINALQASRDMRFGDLAVARGYLQQEQVERLLAEQTNEFMAFSQAVVDHGYMTLEEVTGAVSGFQKKFGLLESDMEALKAGDIERIVPIFLGSDQKEYEQFLALAIKNIYRLVDAHICIGRARTTRELQGEAIGYQKIRGDCTLLMAITGKYSDMQNMAIAYTKEEFIETRGDALDALCELINCINGLYVTQKSLEGLNIELEPPVYLPGFASISAVGMVVMPVYIDNAEIELVVSMEKEVVVR